MGAQYEIWLARDDGTRIGYVDSYESLEYTIVANDVGACKLVLPGTVDRTLYAVDRRLEVWRQPDGGALAQESFFFIRHLRDLTDGNGVRRLEVNGVDGNYLLDGRIVAYAVGSAQADQTNEIDDLMKAVVRENLGSTATDTTRDLTAAGLTVMADVALGTSITKASSRRNVLELLRDLGDAARTAGTQVYFRIVQTSATALEFRTYTGQPGIDRTLTAGRSAILIGVEFGNLAEPALDEDYADEVGYAYAGGQGEGADRVIQTASDTARTGRSLWGRREAFADARNESATAGVTAAANALLAERRPRRRFSGKLLDVPGTQYGRDWNWGDKVTASYAGLQFDCTVRAVRVSVTADGDDVDARLEVES